MVICSADTWLAGGEGMLRILRPPEWRILQRYIPIYTPYPLSRRKRFLI
jgi:hypothetical protein